jgi:hypothetical protein
MAFSLKVSWSPVVLFGATAFALVAFAFLIPVGAFGSGVDIFLHGGYVVLSPMHVQLILAVICGLFAVGYFVCARWLKMPLNTQMARIQFGLVALSIVALNAGMYAAGREFGSDLASRDMRIVLMGVALPSLVFLIGCALFPINFFWTIIRAFRAH